jgi:ubiquinone/menaquinone biosynthesis C-methylase UbiE
MAHDFMNPPGLEIFLDTFIKGRLFGFYFRRYVQKLDIKGDERVLDFGSGSGVVSRHIADLLNDGGELTFLDISPAWMEVARREFGGRTNVKFVTGDLLEMDIAPGSYDAVFVHFALHDVPPEQQPLIAVAFADLLCDGGKLLIREPVKASHGIPAETIRAMMAGAGFKEEWSESGYMVTMGPTYTGMFIKEGV